MTRSLNSNGERTEAMRLSRDRVLRSVQRKAHRRHRRFVGGIGMSRARARKHLGWGRTVVSMKSVHRSDR